MLARNPIVTSIPTVVPFAPPTHRGCGPALATQLDAALAALPVVIASGLDPAVEALLRPLRLPALDLVCRRVRLQGGTRITVVAVPTGLRRRRGARSGLRALKRAARALGRRLLLVPAALLADPTLSVGACR